MTLSYGYISILGQRRKALPLQTSWSPTLATFRFALQDCPGAWKPNPFWMKCAPGVHPVLKALSAQHQTTASAVVLTSPILVQVLGPHLQVTDYEGPLLLHLKTLMSSSHRLTPPECVKSPTAMSFILLESKRESDGHFSKIQMS